jgi:hypothetical protein
MDALCTGALWHPSMLQEVSSCDTSDQPGPTPSLAVWHLPHTTVW